MQSDTDSVSRRLIQRVATRTDTAPLELPPLYDTVDPDALDARIDQMSAGTISFEYAGVVITVDGNGDIQLEEPSSSTKL